MTYLKKTTKNGTFMFWKLRNVSHKSLLMQFILNVDIFLKLLMLMSDVIIFLFYIINYFFWNGQLTCETFVAIRFHGRNDYEAVSTTRYIKTCFSWLWKIQSWNLEKSKNFKSKKKGGKLNNRWNYGRTKKYSEETLFETEFQCNYVVGLKTSI